MRIRVYFKNVEDFLEISFTSSSARDGAYENMVNAKVSWSNNKYFINIAEVRAIVKV